MLGQARRGDQRPSPACMAQPRAILPLVLLDRAGCVRQGWQRDIPAPEPSTEQPHMDPKARGPARCILAVGSGKGGVGKSTLSLNLALAFKHMGFAVGVLDADVYGPNIPLMVGLV